MKRTYIVGEIGPNFVYGQTDEVNMHTLVRLIDAVADAGADCVKVQLKAHGDGCFYDGDDLSRAPHDPARSPFKTRGQYVDKREPDYAMLDLIDSECRARGIEWTASPWDLPSLALLMKFSPPWIKVASASVTNLPLLRAIAETNTPVVMSTGMSTIEEIETAVNALDWWSLTLAVCTASYPATLDTLNLARIAEMGTEWPCPVGWSSHSADPSHAALAVAAGATWIEQHITTGTLRWGPDHVASLTPLEFETCVRLIRECERAMGSSDIGVLPCEEAARARLRRTA